MIFWLIVCVCESCKCGDIYRPEAAPAHKHTRNTEGIPEQAKNPDLSAALCSTLAMGGADGCGHITVPFLSVRTRA